jgi:hypothetical protein
MPLVWTLNPVTGCVRHRQLFQSHCPICRQPLVAFSGRSRPGYCARCGAWLGTAVHGALPPVAPPAADAWPWAAWVGTTLGHLVQAAPHLECPPPRDTVARAFTAYHAHPAAAGKPPSMMAFGRQRVRSSRWAQGERLMQIDLLLRFCWQRDISLVQFLTAPPPVRVPPGAVARPPRAVPDVVTAPGPRTGARRETVCGACEAALATAGPPVSLRAVAPACRARRGRCGRLRRTSASTSSTGGLWSWRSGVTGCTHSWSTPCGRTRLPCCSASVSAARSRPPAPGIIIQSCVGRLWPARQGSASNGSCASSGPSSTPCTRRPRPRR